jgi:mono/diheme cytochrome c family protein
VVVAVPVALAAHQKSNGPAAHQKSSEPGDIASGKTVYVQFCGKCHTLAAVGAKGTLGPNLDQDKVSYTRVVTAIEEGVGGIQAEYVLRHVSFTQVYDVAKFVVAARQAGGTSGENS